MCTADLWGALRSAGASSAGYVLTVAVAARLVGRTRKEAGEGTASVSAAKGCTGQTSGRDEAQGDGPQVSVHGQALPDLLWEGLVGFLNPHLGLGTGRKKSPGSTCTVLLEWP